MASLSLGLKELLTITECTVSSDGSISVGSSSFEVMLNPSSYSHTHQICYNHKKTLGQLASSAKFSGIQAEKVSFDIVIDGTGVVSLLADDVPTQLSDLESVVYKYDGGDHEPNHVQLVWGSFKFYGRLESMAVDYTMFKPSGTPLRAKVKLAFTGFMSKEEEALRANRSSPDLTHIIEVKAGDTLPLLCYKIYKDSRYYLDVARVNNLTHFRNLVPGTRLYFPPLS